METVTLTIKLESVDDDDGTSSTVSSKHVFNEYLSLDDAVYRFEEFLRGAGYFFDSLQYTTNTSPTSNN